VKIEKRFQNVRLAAKMRQHGPATVRLGCIQALIMMALSRQSGLRALLATHTCQEQIAARPSM